MLRMVLADDDFIVRETLREVIPWEEYGITIVGEAEHGQQAFDLCSELAPDILFTDIKMPFMDGLEVAMNLKEAGSKTKIIIISGIQDFNYAKTALEINAEGYILKPIKINDIREVITKVVSNIDMERNMHHKIEQLKQQLNGNSRLMKEKFLRDLLLGVTFNGQEIRDKLDYFQLPLQADTCLMVAVMQMDNYLKQIENKKEAEKQLMSFSIQNITDEIFRNYDAGIVHCLNENEFVLIFNEKSQHDDKHIQICEEMIQSLFKYLKISVSIGTGNQVGSIDRVYASYKNAVHAVQHKFYMGLRSIIRIEDITNRHAKRELDSMDYTNLFEAENRLIGFIMLGDTNGGLQLLDTIFNGFLNSDVESIRGFCMELISGTYRKVYEMGEDLERILPNRNLVLFNILKAEHIQEMKLLMTSIFVEAANYYTQKYNQKHMDLVNKIKAIIKRQYTQNLSLSEIADEVFMSVTYICSVFKRETGETINEYLNQVRMEEAGRLLKTTKMKIWEIAEGLGYDNHNYFSTAFKKYTGLQPQQYRNEHK
ncbi:hypothetical protein BK127_27195 [Paenibacillus sp. FSL H7-0331]|nr:hypothetical protein BK127_27195 [Paenibacillus sp. FSL H7-0331]